MTLTLTELPTQVQDEVARTRQIVSDLHAELPRWELVVWTAGNVSQRIRCADQIGEDLFGTERYFRDAGEFWVRQNKAVALRQEGV